MAATYRKLRLPSFSSRTQNERTDQVLSVHWDTGGLSGIANDANVEWLRDGADEAKGTETDGEGT